MAIENATPLLRLCAQRTPADDENFYLHSASPLFEHIPEKKWASTLDEAERLAVAIAEKHSIAVLVTTVASKVVPWFPSCQLPLQNEGA